MGNKSLGRAQGTISMSINNPGKDHNYSLKELTMAACHPKAKYFLFKIKNTYTTVIIEL